MLIITIISVVFIAWLTLPLISGDSLKTTHAYSSSPKTGDYVVFLNFTDIDESDKAIVEFSAIDFPREFPDHIDTDSTLCISLLALNMTYPERKSRDDFSILERPYTDPTIQMLEIGTGKGGYRGVLLTSEQEACVNLAAKLKRYPSITPGWLSDPRSGTPQTEYPIQIVSSSYYFPFDKRQITADIELMTEQKSGNTSYSENIIPVSSILVDSENWDESVGFEIAESKSHFLEGQEAINIQINLQRPLSLRILSTVLLGSMLLLILYLPFIEDSGSFFEVSVGILLGLWGVQAILIPDYITEVTIIDNFILVLYVVFAFGIFIRFVIRPLWIRFSPRLDSEIQAEEIDLPSIHLPSDSSLVVPQSSPTSECQSNIVMKLITMSTVCITAVITLLHFICKKRSR